MRTVLLILILNLSIFARLNTDSLYTSGGVGALRLSAPKGLLDTLRFGTSKNSFIYAAGDTLITIGRVGAPTTQWLYLQSGNLCVGTTNNTHKLRVAGSAYFSGSTYTVGGDTSDNIATGSIYCTGSSRVIGADSSARVVTETIKATDSLIVGNSDPITGYWYRDTTFTFTYPYNGVDSTVDPVVPHIGLSVTKCGDMVTIAVGTWSGIGACTSPLTLIGALPLWARPNGNRRTPLFKSALNFDSTPTDAVVDVYSNGNIDIIDAAGGSSSTTYRSNGPSITFSFGK